jgi:MFS family permease
MALSIQRLLPFAASTTPTQAATYLLGISLFSISFLVFLNSSVSFVITDLIGQKNGVGDVVGTLGFADEIVALVACPAWGLVSDRLGVRWVAVIGYAIVAVALAVFVQARNVYPQLLLARVLFAVGASATYVVFVLFWLLLLELCGMRFANGCDCLSGACVLTLPCSKPLGLPWLPPSFLR